MSGRLVLSNGSLRLGSGSLDASALLTMNSTDQGLLIPRMDETQRDAIPSPANGLLLFNTDANFFEWYNLGVTSWQLIGNINQGGNSFGTDLSIGTNDGFYLNLRTDGVTRFFIDNAGSYINTPNSDTLQDAGIFAGGASTGDNNGGTFYVGGGTASGDGAGGGISIDAGFAPGTGDGGAIYISSGAAGDTGTGGELGLSAGNSNTGAGGNAYISGGIGTPAGRVQFFTGNVERMAIPGDYTGIEIPAGDDTNNSSFVLSAGNAVSGDNGGGWIEFYGGIGSGDGAGGHTRLQSGNSSGTSPGGAVFLTGGDGIDGNGGPIEITAGNSTNANGGNVRIRPGDGGLADGEIRILGVVLPDTSDFYSLGSMGEYWNDVFADSFHSFNVKLYEGSGSLNGDAITLKAPTVVTAPYTIELPADAPATDTFLKYNGATYEWSAAGSGDINDGGNSFAADISIGTNDAFSLFLRTNNINRFEISDTASILSAPDSNTLADVSLLAGNALSGDNLGGNLMLYAGTGTGTGDGGLVEILGGNAPGAGTAGIISMAGGNSSTGQGGNVYINGGANTTGSTGGSIYLTSGAGDVAAGEIIIAVGPQNMLYFPPDAAAISVLSGLPLRLTDTGANYVGLQAPSTVNTSYTIEFPDDPPASDTFLMYDGADYQWSPAGSGEEWTKYQFTHVDFQTAATQNNIQVFNAAAGTLITAIVIKSTTIFAVGGSTYWLSLGVSGDLTRYADEWIVSSTVADSNFSAVSVVDMTSFGSTTSVRINARSSTNLLNTSTTGAVDIWIRTVVLP